MHRSVSSIRRLFASSGRFYPDTVAKHPDEPTRDKFGIRHHSLYGEGVVAKKEFRKGELLFRFDGPRCSSQTLFTLQKKQGVYVEDPYVMGKILHSCDPNAIADMEAQRFLARRDIHAGEWITMDYESTEDELYRPFDCRCGSDKCRGRIAGKKSRSSLRK